MVNPNRIFRDAIYEQFARIGKAISCPKRLELLELLVQGPRTVEVLAAEAKISVANTSKHLQLLRTTHLVTAEKQGLFVTYRVTDQSVGEFVRSLRILAENQLAEVEQITRLFLADKEGLEPVDRQKLLDGVREGTVTVLDVRPVEEYRSGHIPGAISVPLKELENYLDKLPRDREIVAYCRGPYCVLAIQAVEKLRSKGFSAARLEEGIPDWQALGLPVALGDKPR